MRSPVYWQSCPLWTRTSSNGLEATCLELNRLFSEYLQRTRPACRGLHGVCKRLLSKACCFRFCLSPRLEPPLGGKLFKLLTCDWTEWCFMAAEPGHAFQKGWGSGVRCSLVASLLLVAMPGAPSSFLFLVVRPGAPSSVLAPTRDHIWINMC